MKSSAGLALELKNTNRLLGFIFASLLLCAPLFSQGSSGRIVGTITDADGGAIAGATVTVLDVDRGTPRTLTTDESGEYNAPSLLPGNYQVRAEFKGFKAIERKNIVLEVAQEVRVDLALQPGEQAQTITVTEDLPLVETTNAELGGTIENKVINDLPLNGRNFTNLLNLRPGVTKYAGNSAWTQSSNGLRPHDNVYMVDGTNSTDPWMAQSMMNAVMAAGDAGTMLPIDAIDEFKTMENPRAEFGWKPGSIVNVGIKSGQNTIHGSGYAYGRTTTFDARDYFNNTPATDPTACSPDPTPCTKAPVELEQWGASVGGAIKKDKLFYFGNFETQNYSVGNPTIHSMPITTATDTTSTHKGTAASLVGACQAALPASGGTGVTALSAQLAGLSTSCVPLPNYPGLFLANNTASTSGDTSLVSQSKIYSGVGKLDYHINDKNSLSGMYFRSPGSGTFVDDPTNEISPAWLTVQNAYSQVVSVGETWAPNSLWVNSFRFGFSHYYQTYTTPDANQNPANYSYNGATYNLYTGQTDPAYFGFPRTRISQFGGYELGLAWPKTVGPDSVWQFNDSVSYLHGKHTFKFGGEVLIDQSTNNVANNTKGSFKFPTLTDFFQGNLNQATIATGNYARQLQNEGYAVFAQDDWRITSRLTVNLGLRYELSTVIKEKNNLIGNFEPAVGLEQVGKQIPSLYTGDHNNFSPRLGFAWDVTGNGKTVVRGGGSIMYEQLSYDMMMAYNNLWGLKSIPSGANLYANGALLSPATAGGTINNSAVLLSGTQALGLVSGAVIPGSIDSNWANNSSTTPLYNFSSAACGDGTPVPGVATTPQPCSILAMDRNLRTPYVGAWSLGIQRALTNNLYLDVNYVGNHGTKFPGLADINQPARVGGFSAGWGNPGVTGTPAQLCLASATDVTKGVPTPYDNCSPSSAAEVAAEPFHTTYPYLGNILMLSNNNHSNYNALQVAMTERTSHGLSFVMGYTYSHSLGQTPDNWNQPTPTDSTNVKGLYGTTQFDMTHVFTFSTTYAIPGINAPGQILKGWSLNSIVTLESATPWSVNDWTTDFSGTGEIGNPAGVPGGANAQGEQWDFFGNPIDFRTTESLANTNGGWQSGGGGLPYFAGTSNATCLARSAAMGPLAIASLTNLGCYVSLNGKSVLVPPPYGSYGTTAPYMFRGPAYANVDFSITKVFKFKEHLSAQFRAEFFNIFNHPNMSNPYGGPGGSNTYTDPSGDAGASFGFQPSTSDVVNSNPVLGSGGPRAMQLGLKLIF